MIYSIKVLIDIEKNYLKDNYYNILGSMLNLIGENQTLKDSILSISNIYKTQNESSQISMSINGKQNFNEIITIIQNKKEVNINGKIFNILGIDFNFNIFDDNTTYNEYRNIELNFKTPTIIKKQIEGIDINQLLPIPEVFLLSAIRKYNNFYDKNLDLEDIKQKLKKYMIVVSFDIKTKQVKIKGNIKAGVIGKIKYTMLEGLELETKVILYNALHFVNIVGIGTSARLGLGQVGVYFSN